MTKNLSLRIGSRDLEILQALDRCPLTPEQLLRLSQSFQQPFTDAHNVRRRLRELFEAELIRSFVYAMANDGRSPRYYKLTRDGYRFCTVPMRLFRRDVTSKPSDRDIITTRSAWPNWSFICV